MASFGPIAPHYDLLMAQVPYDMWSGYYRLLLAEMQSDPDTLLDVCCGTGTLCEMLTDDGYICEGVDLSPSMIEAARAKAQSSGREIVYHVADAAEMSLGKTYEGAFSFFDSLNYITELERFRMALRRVYEHLEPGGVFIFDLNTAYAFREGMFDQSETRPKAPIRYQWHGHWDEPTRIIRVEMDFWRDGEQFHEVHVQRAHRHEEVVQGLQDAGFTGLRAYDSYTLDPPRKRSDRIHYAARKPE